VAVPRCFVHLRGEALTFTPVHGDLVETPPEPDPVAGSVGGTAEDIKDVYAYFATGKLKPQLHQISFEEIPEGLERLHRGEVKGRLVAVR